MSNKLKLVFVGIVMAFPLLGFAASATQGAATGPNNVYIEQLGSSNTVTIEQVGGSNDIGGTASTTPSATNYATINGSSNTVTITQTGDNNLGQYDIKGGNNVYTSTVTGYDNNIKLNIGNTNNATNMRNTVTETVTGDTNTLVTTLVGSDNVSTTTVTGNSNQVTEAINTSNGTVSNTTGTILQFLYGYDGYDAAEMVDSYGSIETSPFNIFYLASIMKAFGIKTL